MHAVAVIAWLFAFAFYLPALAAPIAAIPGQLVERQMDSGAADFLKIRASYDNERRQCDVDCSGSGGYGYDSGYGDGGDSGDNGSGGYGSDSGYGDGGDSNPYGGDSGDNGSGGYGSDSGYGDGGDSNPYGDDSGDNGTGGYGYDSGY